MRSRRTTLGRVSSPPAADLPAHLRSALRDAGFTAEAVAELLGTQAQAALGRNETTPALRRTTGGSPLETLTRLFVLQTPVDAVAAESALPGLLESLAAAGLVAQSVGEVAARLDVRPCVVGDQDMWVVSDRNPGLDGGPQRLAADQVLGISPASTSLAQLTMREHVGRSLDLGTGCGVQALHLAAHSDRVVATDVNSRALWMTRFNLGLNDVTTPVDVRDGSFFEPVHGKRFDLISTNPPFVISPGTGERLVYRDSGLPGDSAVEHIVRTAPEHLVEGGWCQVLANWVVHRDVAWEERLGAWIDPDCDALVVQREILDPAAYVELWLKDAGLHPSTGGAAAEYRTRYDTWLSWFDEQGVEGIGFGWVNLRRRPSATDRTRSFLQWPYDVEQPIAPAIRDWGDAVDASTGSGIGPDSRLVLLSDVEQETVGQPGAEDPETVVLRQQRGLRRARRADTVEAALVGACDGELTVGQILDALSQLLELDPEQTRATYLPAVEELFLEGFLDHAQETT